MSRFSRINNIVSLASSSTGINTNLTISESVSIYFKQITITLMLLKHNTSYFKRNRILFTYLCRINSLNLIIYYCNT